MIVGCWVVCIPNWKTLATLSLDCARNCYSISDLIPQAENLCHALFSNSYNTGDLGVHEMSINPPVLPVNICVVFTDVVLTASCNYMRCSIIAHCFIATVPKWHQIPREIINRSPFSHTYILLTIWKLQVPVGHPYLSKNQINKILGGAT